jgi:hypothetical protein
MLPGVRLDTRALAKVQKGSNTTPDQTWTLALGLIYLDSSLFFFFLVNHTDISCGDPTSDL